MAVCHPHIHYVVPGGGVKLDSDGQAELWQSTAKNFLFHHGTLKYLAPYVHRVAISDSRIVEVTDNTVTYKIRRKGNRMETKTVAGVSFVEDFAQHVLPTGFMKIRHYGWMSGNSKITTDEVKWLVWMMLGWMYWLGSDHSPQPEKLTATMRCHECGGEMRVVEVTYQSLQSRGILPEQGLTYFDSGIT